MDQHEMHDRISALIGAVAKAFDVSDAEVISAVEEGRLSMEMMEDHEGQNFLHATLDDRQAQIYPGAIFCSTGPSSGGCGGGCSCG